MTSHDLMLIDVDRNVNKRIKIGNGLIVQTTVKETLMIKPKMLQGT